MLQIIKNLNHIGGDSTTTLAHDTIDINLTESIFQEILAAHIAILSKDQTQQSRLPPLWDLLQKLDYPVEVFKQAFAGT